MTKLQQIFEFLVQKAKKLKPYKYLIFVYTNVSVASPVSTRYLLGNFEQFGVCSPPTAEVAQFEYAQLEKKKRVFSEPDTGNHMSKFCSRILHEVPPPNFLRLSSARKPVKTLLG